MAIELEEDEVLEILRNNPDAYIIYWQLIRKVDFMCPYLLPISFDTFLKVKSFLKKDVTRNEILREYYILNDDVVD